MQEVPEYRSEDGRFLVEFRMTEGPRMSHVIVAPRVTDLRDGTVLLDLWSASTWDWDGSVVGSTGSTIDLAVRRYPGNVGCTVTIDADARTYALRDQQRAGKGLAPLLERLRLAGLAPA